jgi:hypothetical protein
MSWKDIELKKKESSHGGDRLLHGQDCHTFIDRT